MANWTLIFPLGVPLKGIYPSAAKQTEDERWPNVPNMKDGSSHAPTAQIIVTGLGMSITPLVSTNANLDVVNTKAITWKTGSLLKTEAGSTTTLEGVGEIKSTYTISATGKIQTSGAGKIFVETSGEFQVKSGGKFTLDSGAIVSMNLGGAAAAALTFLDANGAATWASASVALWQNGSHFTVSGGAFANITIGSGNAGSLSLGALATFSVLSSCVSSIAIGASSTFSTAAGSSVTANIGTGGTVGTLNLGALSTTNLQGAFIPGVGGSMSLRRVQGVDGAMDLDASIHDIVECTSTLLTADREWTLINPPAGTSPFLRVRRLNTVGSLHTLTIKFGVSTLVSLGPTSDIHTTITFYWELGSWTVFEATEFQVGVTSPLAGFFVN